MFSLHKNSYFRVQYFALICLLFLVGCQPFVKLPPGPGSSYDVGVITNQDGTKKIKKIYETERYKDETVEFAEAEAFARMSMATYKDKIIHDAGIQSVFTVGLIPMAAAATGLAAYSNNGQTVAGLGLAAATGYGMNTFLNLPLRSRIYALGTKAMGCAITAARPLNIDRAKLDFALDGKTDQQELTEKLAELKTNLENIKQIFDAGIPPKGMSEKKIKAAKNAVDKAIKIAIKGLASSFETAPSFINIKDELHKLTEALKGINDSDPIKKNIKAYIKNSKGLIIEAGTLALNDGKHKPGLGDKLVEIEAILAKLRDLKSEIKPAEKATFEIKVDSKIKSAEAVVEVAEKAYLEGSKLSEAAKKIGGELVDAVYRISTDVDLALNNTQTELNAIPGIVGGLSELSKQFTGRALPTPKVQDKNGKSNEEGTESLEKAGTDIDNELAALAKMVKKVSFDQRKIAAFVEAVKANRSKTKLEDCGVDPEQFITDIYLEPEGEIVITQGDSMGRIVKGGQKPFMVEIEKKSGTKKPEIQQFDFLGRAFSIQTESDTSVGTYNLYVRDGKDHHSLTQIKVEAKPLPSVSFDIASNVFETPTADKKITVKAVITPEPEKDISVNWVAKIGEDERAKGTLMFKKGASSLEFELTIGKADAGKEVVVSFLKGPLIQLGVNSKHTVIIRPVVAAKVDPQKPNNANSFFQFPSGQIHERLVFEEKGLERNGFAEIKKIRAEENFLMALPNKSDSMEKQVKSFVYSAKGRAGNEVRWSENDNLMIVVSHAEQETQSGLQNLSESGVKRVNDLAKLVKNSGIKNVFVTPTCRSVETGALLIEKLKEPISPILRLYNVSDGMQSNNLCACDSALLAKRDFSGICSPSLSSKNQFKTVLLSMQGKPGASMIIGHGNEIGELIGKEIPSEVYDNVLIVKNHEYNKGGKMGQISLLYYGKETPPLSRMDKSYPKIDSGS